MLNPEKAAELAGATVLSADDQQLGTIDEVYTQASEDSPAWGAVKLDDGGKVVLVPLAQADVQDGTVRLQYDAALVSSAPGQAGDTFDPQQEQPLYDHYGIHASEITSDTGHATNRDGAADQGTAPNVGQNQTPGHPG